MKYVIVETIDDNTCASTDVTLAEFNNLKDAEISLCSFINLGHDAYIMEIE